MNLAKFLKTSFLQKPPEDYFCFYLFRSSHRRCSLKKGVLENTFGLRDFQKHLFYRTPLDDYFWLFCARLLKWGTANNVWTTSDEYSLSTYTNLRITVQVYNFFSREERRSVYVSIGLHCLLSEAATRVEVFCKKKVLLKLVCAIFLKRKTHQV